MGYAFFKSEKKLRLNVGEKTYPIDTQDQIKNILSDILIGKIDLNRSDKNILADKLRKMIKS